MTLFRFDFFTKNRSDDNSWDGMKPPGLTLRSLYYDLKCHNKLNRVDGLPLLERTLFLFIKIIQIIAYNKGWKEGGKK